MEGPGDAGGTLAPDEGGAVAQLRKYWELPAIAHFCSLFRGIFKLIDFDIEDLEEALSIDCTTKHSLIVDLLISLLKGCTGRRDVTLLNYNQFLWDVVGQRWLEEGRGEERNPLGSVRDKADFHVLPLYPKLKLLHWLCELRLQRPDVETLTKNLDGESLRVLALGKDDKGATYWYFYGTRLYKEEPEPLKLRLPKHQPEETTPSRSATPANKRGRKAKTPKGRNRKRKRTEPTDDEEEAPDTETESPAMKTPATATRGRPKRPSTSKAAKKGKAEETPASTPTPAPTPNSQPSRRSMRMAARRGLSIGETDAPTPPPPPEPEKRMSAGDSGVEDEEEESENGETRASSVVPTSEAGTEDETPIVGRSKLMMRVKARLREEEASRESWREGSVSSAAGEPADMTSQSSAEPDDPDASNLPDEESSNQDGSMIGNTTIKDMITRMYSRNDEEEEDDDESPQSTEASAVTPPETPNITAKSKEPEPEASPVVGIKSEGPTPTPAEDNVPNEAHDTLKEPSEAVAKPEQKMEAEEAAAVKEEEPVEDPTPWDQPFLRPDPCQTARWSLCCSKLEEWTALAEEMGRSRSKAEKALEVLLTTDFLPEMAAMFENKAAERERREAELCRRTSERVEIRRLQEEEEKEKMAKREKEERQKLEVAEMHRRRRLEAEDRERRRKEREKERDKAAKLRDRAREDRSRRLVYRQQRQERIANGLPVPDELLHHPGSGYDEAEEKEMELDHAYGQLEKVIDALKKHPDSEPFLAPVTEDIAPDYAERIEKPMCIEAIEDKLIDRSYNNKLDFVEDVNLIFLNCLEYNGIDSEYTRLAKSVEKGFVRAWHKYFPTINYEETSERVRKENWTCIQSLNALEKKVNELLRPKPAPPRPMNNYSLSPGQGPSASSARTQPFGTKKAVSGLPPPARAPYGSNAAYRVFPTSANRTMGPSTGGVAKFASTLRIKSPANVNRFTPLGPAGGGPRRVYMPASTSGAPVRFLSPAPGAAIIRRTSPGNMATPGRVISNFTPAGPRAQVIRAQPAQRPSVYLLPSSDGENRLLKFVTKNGEPASHDLVQHLLPQLKKEAHKLPKGLLTLTIDSQDVNDGSSPSKTTPLAADVPGPSADAPGPSGTTATAPALVAEGGPPDLGLPETEPGKEEGKPTPTPAPLAGKRFYHIGDNSYLAIEDGNPYLYNKQQKRVSRTGLGLEESGELVRVQQVSRDGLLEKLKRIQAQKAGPGEPKPVCSVAPQLQARSVVAAGAPAILIPASSIPSQGGTVVVVPSRQTTAVIASPPAAPTAILVQQPPPVQAVEVLNEAPANSVSPEKSEEAIAIDTEQFFEPIPQKDL